MAGFFKATNLGGSYGQSMFGAAPGNSAEFGSPPLGWGGQSQGGGGGGFGSAGGTPGFSAGAAGAKLDPNLLQSMLAQILQQGPNMGSVGMGGDPGLDPALADIQSQEDRSRTSLKSRFSGMGRPLSSTEYTSQEAELIDTFRRARDSARANAARFGLAQQQAGAQQGLATYSAQVNPLVRVLQLMSAGGI